MTKPVIYPLAGLMLGLAVGPTFGQSEVDGILGLRPVGSRSCLAQEIQIPDGHALAGLRWYNNDGTQAFPELVLLQRSGAAVPNLQDAGLTLANVSGQSLSWSEVTLATPLSYATGAIFAVFVLPPHAERVGRGAGGGAGIGFISQASGPRAFVSVDGLEWLPMHPKYRLAVEPVLQQAGGSAWLLSSAVGASSGIAVPQPEVLAAARSTQLLAPTPNPFNPRTEIRFELAQPGEVNLTVFDLRGQRVRTLSQAVWRAGIHATSWLGTDGAGKPAASGVYLVRMEVGGRTWTQRVALVR